MDRNTSGRVRARPVNACLFPLYAAEGAAVVTVEGLRGGSATGGGSGSGCSGEQNLLHPLPAALANAHGSQCGFCSPGFVMAAHSCLAAHAARRMGREGEVLKEDGGGGDAREGARPAAEAPSPSSCRRAQKPAEDIEDVFSGNLCRCTGYRPIIDAFRPFFDEGEGEEKTAASAAAAGKQRCFAPPARPSGEEEEDEVDIAPPLIVDASALLPRELLTRPKPELFFPAASSGESETDGGVEWHRPTSLRSLLRLRAANPQCTLVGGNTEVGIECAQKGARHAFRVDVASVPEMAVLDFGEGEGKEEGGITVGAGATLEDLFEAAKGSACSSGAASALAAQLRRFAGRAVRAAAVVGGNVATASPASDLNPVFVACGASFDLASLGSENEKISIRRVPAAEFFKGYRQVDLAPGEVLLRARLPRWGGDGGLVADGAAAAPSPSSPLRRRPLDFVQAFKQARRRDDDISIVTACLAVKFEAQKVKRREGGGNEGEEEQEEAFVVSEASFCFGGVAATPLLAPRAARALVGSRWSFESYERALRALTSEDVVVSDDAPGGAVPYRRALVGSALARFFASAHRRLLEVVRASSGEGSSLSAPPPLPPWLSAAAEGLPPRPPPRSLQYWDQKEAPAEVGGTCDGDTRHRVIGAPVRHLSAGLQASGAARYVADEPLPPGTLHGALVLSTRAAARVAVIDPSRALAAAGNADSKLPSSSSDSNSSTVLFFGAADVPGTNRWGPFLGDPLFLGVGDRSEAVGLPVGIVVADSEARARRAALLVDVEYSDDGDGDGESGSGGDKSCSAAAAAAPSSKRPPILTIEDAIAAGSFFEGMDREIERGEGDIDELFESYRREMEEGRGKPAGVNRRVAVVEGSVRIGGQEHFYLEPHSVLVTPGEPRTSAELDVLSSTQSPYGTQLDAARAVGLPLHAVVCRATRLGGGFGGKETRAGGVAAAAAVAAVRSGGRPVRLVLERHVDAAISGGRHPFYVEWRVAAEAVVVEEKEESGGSDSSSSSSSNILSARVLAADLRLFSNGGCSPDLSGPVMERALTHCANAYNVPGRLRARGRVARTNATSNTAFRGFGAPQGMLAFECAVEQASAALGVAPELLREGSMV